MAQPQQLITAEEFLDQLGTNGAFDGLDTPTLDRAAQWASRKALSYVSKRKVLPLVAFGDDLRSCVGRLMGYDLMCNQGYAPQSGSEQIWRDRYLDEIQWLTQVSQGIVELLDCVDSSTTPTVDVASPLTVSDTRVNWDYQSSHRSHSNIIDGDAPGGQLG